MITIVLADGKIVAGEVHVLENVCNLLGIKTQFIIDSIDRMVQKAA